MFSPRSSQLSEFSGTVARALTLLRALLRRTDRDVHFVVCVTPGANIAALTSVVRELGADCVTRQ